ncbi:MAG: ethanolamine ammonia-lyase reactivating factor EutA [Chloroflexi bacterium]|nr:ethanolamine ammonia-lyase reactivating factor EutA [Chloroflexota bacterium]
MVEGFRFAAAERHLLEEDHIQLTSVGVDIGSSTSHLVFSRLELERENNRYVTVNRTIVHESGILLTPYIDDTKIDENVLGRFIDEQYKVAKLRRAEIDTGALILTGVALLRHNARAIGDLFSQEAGRFVAVSAGDNLEATMAAYGSGAVAFSAEGQRTVMNVDIGGGTTKIALCSQGKVMDVMALDVGARLVAWDGNRIITNLEEAGRLIGEAVGLNLSRGRRIEIREQRAMAAYMADALFEVINLASLSPRVQKLLRTSPLAHVSQVDAVTFSGGVSEFIYGREANQFGDLGHLLAEEIKARVGRIEVPMLESKTGIRATVIGASQYTVQVSGSTIFLSPLDIVPIRNIPVVAPDFSLDGDDIDPVMVQEAIKHTLNRFDLLNSNSPVALALHWEGSATYDRIHTFCAGIVTGMETILGHGHPLVLIYDEDVGGLLGIHLKEEMRLPNPVVSIDGVELREFDYVDIGDFIATSGAVPIVIKSLVFPR